MHLRAIPHLLLQRGYQEAQVKGLPDPSSLRKSAEDGAVHHRAGDGGTASGGDIHQNREERDGGDSHQTSRCTPPVRGQPGHIYGLNNRACSNRYHGIHGDIGSAKPLQRCRAKGDKLSDPTTLAPNIWSGKLIVVADGGRICGVASERSTPLGSLTCVDTWTTDCTR